MTRTNFPIWLIPALLFSAKALASEHGEGLDAHSTRTIIYQCINVVLLLGGLFYFLRKPAKEFFQNKRMAFVAAATKAEELKRSAEQARSDMQVKLTRLESTADESLARAKAEAADMKKALIAEAQALSKRIREEAEAASKLEAEKAKHQLREQMIREATAMASKQMAEKITGDDQKRLQSEFIDNIQAVRT